MKIERYAAIDIGSNAVRVLISNVVVSPGTPPKYMKSSLVRVPIRLGQDSFTVGEISPRNIKRMVKAMKAFKLIMKVNNVKKYMACATSALREANNASEVIQEVKKKTGIEIQVIDGKREAEIISTTNIFESINKNRTFLFIDVGGGSGSFCYIPKGVKCPMELSTYFRINQAHWSCATSLVGQTIDLNRFKQQEKNVEEARKKKRKRISKETPGGQNKSGSNNNRKSGQKQRNRPAAVVKVEPTEEEVQKQIRETLEKLQGKTNKSKGAKYRRDKRVQHRQKTEEELAQQEAESKVLKVTEFITVGEIATLMEVGGT